MQTNVVMKDLTAKPSDHLARCPRLHAPECRDEYQRCSSFASLAPPRSVLLIGPERPDEFADALWLARQGHNVTVVNPKETSASKKYMKEGGIFVRARVEELPRICSRFHLICENYPYPSGEQYVPPRAFALARLSRLAPGGRWVLFTEAVRFATLLKGVVDYNDDLRSQFSCSFSSLSPCQAPPSAYPPTDTRLRLVFKRRR